MASRTNPTASEASASPSRSLALVPVGGDPIEAARPDGDRTWIARSFTPTLEARAVDGRPLAPGWYLVSASLDPRSGDVRHSRVLVPDAAGHFMPWRSVRLHRRPASHRAIFFLPWPVDVLRLLGSDCPCEFACDGLRVRRLAFRPAPRHRLATLADGIGPVARALALAAAMSRKVKQRIRARMVRWLDADPPVDIARRKRLVLQAIDRGRPGIEIGPSHDPIAPKRGGFDVHVIDHMSRQELREKYRGHPIALDGIEEVDFVWKGERYLDLTGKPGHYGWIIASNVIEHAPDLIAFLADCESILSESGVLCLVVPDKRFTFDRFRPLTGLAGVVDGHIARRHAPSPGVVVEHHLNAVGRNHRLGWTREALGEYAFIHSATQARGLLEESQSPGAYLDVHNWCFVPHSFRLLMADLHALGFTRLRECGFHATQGCEFHLDLSLAGRGPGLSRLEMLRRIDDELAWRETDRVSIALLRRLLR